MKRRTLSLLAALGLGTSLLAQAQEPVIITHVNTLTGALRAYGEQLHIGLRMGFEYATDGTMTVEGRPIKLIEKDDQMNPARAALEYDGFFGRTRLEATVDRFLGIDLLVHGWDIARATGQDETLPDAEVARVYADVVELGDSLRAEGVCGPAVEVPADAPAQDRLLAFLGRTP